MPRRWLLALFLVALPGCGGPAAPSREGTAARMRSAGHQSNSLALPRLGTFTARCPASGPYELRFTADNDTATDDVTARVHGGATRHESIDPGEALTVKVSAGQPVVWRLRQDTEPDTIRARARISLAPGDAGESCSFARARTRLVTHSHAVGG